MPECSERLEKPRLLTNRLLLRPLRPKDAEAVFEAIQESRASLRPWMPWVMGTLTADDSRQFIQRFGRSPHDIVWGIWDANGKRLRFCGNVGLHRIAMWQSTAMMGYWVRMSCEGRGYATEASAAVLLWAFDRLKLARIEITAATQNIASRRVIEKLGFVPEGVLREAQRIPRRRRRLDWLLASLVRSDLGRERARLAGRCGTRWPWKLD
jgi:ribosomal-protein-serine acetyltransferase